MKKLLGIFLATLAMFIFGAVFWMTPLTTSFYLQSDDDEAVGPPAQRHVSNDRHLLRAR